MFWTCLSVCLSVCPSVRLSVRLSVCHAHGYHFSVHFFQRQTVPAGQYLYHVKAHPSNCNNQGSVFSCGQNFRRKWRLKVPASDISPKLSVHFSRSGTLLGGQNPYHMKARASKNNNQGSVFSCDQNFRRKWRLKIGANDTSHQLSVHYSRRGTVLAGQYLYHMKAHPSNCNNQGSVFSCSQNFRRKWRLKVPASDISPKLSVHFSRSGTLLGGQNPYHMKARASKNNNQGSVFSCDQNFRRKWRLNIRASDTLQNVTDAIAPIIMVWLQGGYRLWTDASLVCLRLTAIQNISILCKCVTSSSYDMLT